MARKTSKPKKVKTVKRASSKIRRKAAPKRTAARISIRKKKKTIVKVPPVKKTITKRREDLITARMGPEEIIAQLTRGVTDEFRIEGSKFDIGVPHNAHAISPQDIPFEYGKDRAALLIVDPKFVFAYWEIRHDTLQRAMHEIKGHAKLSLRFYDITSGLEPGACPSWDVEVFDRLGNWYLRLEHPEQRLCIDVGLKGSHGQFVRLARSNVMKLPPQTLAKPGPIKWMVVSPSGDKLLSDIEDYTDADLALLKKILGPYFYDLLIRGRFASIAGSSIEAIFYDVNALHLGESPTSGPPWATPS